MSFQVHVYDTVSKSDLVVPIDVLISTAQQHTDPDDIIHALIDAAQVERVAEHSVTRGVFQRTAWNVASEPDGSLLPNVWHTIGIGANNRFSPDARNGWLFGDFRNSRWICPQAGWYDLDVWMRAAISAPAVHLYKITSAHFGFEVVRHANTPRNILQLDTLDLENGTTKNLDDVYAPFTYTVGPPEGSTTTYLRGWGLNGAACYPFYPGDELKLVWSFQGLGIDFLDFLEARIDIQRVESIKTSRFCCGDINAVGGF